MATYWVTDLPYIKSISDHLWCSIFIFGNGALYAGSSLWPYFKLFELKITNTLKSSGWGLKKIELPWEKNLCFLQNYYPTKFQWSAQQIGQNTCKASTVIQVQSVVLHVFLCASGVFSSKTLSVYTCIHVVKAATCISC